MIKYFIINRQKLNVLLYSILCISLLLLAAACGEVDHSSSGTGSISFSVEWQGAPTIKDASGSVVTRTLDCNNSGVATVEGEIYDENDTYLAGGGPWNCSAHAGTIENVPEGSNRKAVILGKDSSGAIIYQGEKTGISVTAGQTTNAGTITVSPTSTISAPTGVNAIAGDGQVTISWDSVSGATSYKIYWATWSGVSKTDYEDTHSPETSANPDTTVFDMVLSYNGHTYAATKNNMTWEEANTLSDQHGGYLVTINDAQENAFLTQNYLSFLSELWIGYNDKDNEGTWVWTNGETSTYTNWDADEPNGAEYESCACIYSAGEWNDLPCANLIFAIVEWEPVAATSYTYTDLTNGTTYYYVVTAVNSYGESDESSEVNATPVHSWTMLNLPDTGQTQSYTSTFGEDSDYTINPPSYTDNGNGTITDNVTSLIWQKEDDNTTRTWDDAVTCCNDLTLAGYSDWRLSSRKELMGVVDYGSIDPSIDTTYFPGTNVLKYWSSTTSASSSSSAWPVHFSDGSVDDIYGKTGSYYVRCVRGQELSFGNFTDNGVKSEDFCLLISRIKCPLISV